jgi:hypothetical protein
MIILNETIIVEDQTQAACLQWLKSDYLPTVKNSGLFSQVQVLTLLNSPNPGVTYCLQYTTDSNSKIELFKQSVGQQIKAELFKKFENKFVLFDSVMQLTCTI